MDALKEFGLTGYEIKIYTSLLKQGKSNAKEISLISKVPPTAVYPNLNSLEEKGLIKSFKGEISYFEVVAPSVALKHLARLKSNTLFNLEKELSPKLLKLKDARIDPVPDPVELSSGAEASLDLTEDLIAKSNDSLYVVGWGFRKVKTLHKAMRLFRLMAKKDIVVKIIFGDKNNLTSKLHDECKKLGLASRYYPMEACSIVVCDTHECKLTLKRRDLRERVNIHITDEHLVSAFSNYASLLWDKAYSFN